jgi:Tfp pilus assembly protein PilN
MKDINLLPTRRIIRLAMLRRTLRWGMGAGVYSALVAFGVVATYAGTGPSRAAAQRERSEIESSIDAGKREIALLNQQLADARHRLKTSMEVSKHPDWSILLGVLADLRDPSMVLDKVELSKLASDTSPSAVPAGKKKVTSDAPARFVLKVSGLGESLDAVPAFVLRLESAGLFSSVKLVESRVADLRGRQVSMFRIDCTLVDAEGATP